MKEATGTMSSADGGITIDFDRHVIFIVDPPPLSGKIQHRQHGASTVIPRRKVVFSLWTPGGRQIVTLWRNDSPRAPRRRRYSIECFWWQKLRSRIFDRCENCGHSFKGTTAYPSRWENDKPGWFQSTPGLYHIECLRERDAFSHHLRKIKLNRALRIHEGP